MRISIIQNMKKQPFYNDAHGSLWKTEKMVDSQQHLYNYNILNKVLDRRSILIKIKHLLMKI